jgi:hypothetical protein
LRQFGRLIVVLALLVQSLQPVSAMAYISMRCAGMPQSSPACARTAASADYSLQYVVQKTLSCCPCCRFSAEHIAALSAALAEQAPPFTLTSPACQLSVHFVTFARISSQTSGRESHSIFWLTTAAVSGNPYVVYLSTMTPCRSFFISRHIAAGTASHGLRAPPIS